MKDTTYTKRITCPVDYVCGYLRYGHYELDLTEEAFQKFQQSSDEEKVRWLRDGDFIVDSYSIDDIDTPSLGNIHIESIEK